MWKYQNKKNSIKDSTVVKYLYATENTQAENVKVEPTVSEDVQENEPRNLPTLIDEISGCAERIGKQEADDSENSSVVKSRKIFCSQK